MKNGVKQKTNNSPHGRETGGSKIKNNPIARGESYKESLKGGK